MKKGLIIVLLLVAMDAWGQSAWIYDRQWDGLTMYVGSGRAEFDYYVDFHDKYFQRVERPSNEQINLIKYGLRQYTVRINDVYVVSIGNDISKRTYVALVIITSSISSDGGYNFSYLLWEDLTYRRK